MTVAFHKLKETLVSVLPVTLLVLLLHFTLVPLPYDTLGRFLLGALFIILGLAVFLLGVDIAIAPVGQAIGGYVTRKKSLAILLAAGLVLGFAINIAEPDLLVLAKEIATATAGTLSVMQILVVVSLGVGTMLAVGLLRMVYQIPLKNVLLVAYAVVLVLAALTPRDFLGIAFDAGGATTGSMTVPFILALGLGVASSTHGKSRDEDAFGLTAVASTGPMLAVMTMALLSGLGGVTNGGASESAATAGILMPFVNTFLHTAQEVLTAILPLIIITLLMQRFALHLGKRTFYRIMIGFVYTYIGFVFFLTGVNAGFMEAGRMLGKAFATMPLWLNLAVAAVIGMVVILAEPSVHVLTEQIEDITAGAIHKNSILVAFALGVSLAIVLSVLRLRVPSLQLWAILLAGYLVALVLSRFTPPLFVGIAFDSGGVASGPMTATFVLAFAQGIATRLHGAAGLVDAFGVIALVALTPLITLQLFGLLYERKRKALLEAAEKEETP